MIKDTSDITAILQHDKGLLFQEKLSLISTNKQMLGVLATLTGVLFAGALQYNRQEVYIAVPFVILGIASFLLANFNTLNLVTAHLQKIDVALVVANPGATGLLFQGTTASEMSEWGFCITAGRRRLSLNPNVLLAFFSVLLGGIAFSISVLRGYDFLLARTPRAMAPVFFFASIYSALLVAICSVHYLVSARRIRREIVTPLMNK